MKPWEKYQPQQPVEAPTAEKEQSGPWGKYTPAAPAVTQTTQSPSIPPTPSVSAAEGARAGLTQGGTFGFGDEIGGGFNALFELISPSDPSKGRLESAKEGYFVGRDAERERVRQAQEQQPGAYTAGQIAGIVPSLAYAPVGVAARGAGLAQGLGAGAAIGGLTGFGTAEGTPEEQLASTLKGAATGATVGGVVGAIPRAASQLAGSRMAQGVVDKSNAFIDKVGSFNIGGSPVRVGLLEVARPQNIQQAIGGAAGGVAGAAKSGTLTGTAAGAAAGTIAVKGAEALVRALPEGVKGVVKDTAKRFAYEQSGRPDSDQQSKPKVTNWMPVAAQTSAAPKIQSEMEQGRPFGAIHNVLQQTDPEYREQIRADEPTD